MRFFIILFYFASILHIITTYYYIIIGGVLLAYHHGPLPVDYMYLVAYLYIKTGYFLQEFWLSFNAEDPECGRMRIIFPDPEF